MKKIIIIITIVLMVAILGLAGYYLFFQKNSDGTVGNINKFKNFFPFGQTGIEVATTTPDFPIQETSTTTPSDYTKKLREISSEPVAGAGLADFKAGTVVRYVERATGHIYEVELFSPSKNRISNTTMPMAYNAFWGNNNNSTAIQFLKNDDQTIRTYSISIKSSLSTTTSQMENNITGVEFPEKINSISVFGNNLFYIAQTDNSSVGEISSFDGKNKKQIWNSALKEVTSQYVDKNTIAITTKPYENEVGYMYFVNTSSGQLKRIMGEVYGLSTLVNQDATKVLYISQNDNLNMMIYNISTKSSYSVTPKTFPEKCVWSKKNKNIIYCAVPEANLYGNSLTLWYMGYNSFSDNIWKIDISNNTSSIVENLSNESGQSIDVINPILSENEQYLVFTNKTNNSLWSLDLTK